MNDKPGVRVFSSIAYRLSVTRKPEVIESYFLFMALK